MGAGAPDASTTACADAITCTSSAATPVDPEGAARKTHT